MKGNKNIITWAVKIAIGLGSFLLIYWRLRKDFTPDKIDLLQTVFADPNSYLLVLLCIILIPINWGIESYKWQMVTKNTEAISFSTAMQSVYSGVCIGNLAPGRATEFLAKILFFKVENRPAITLLHFVNGMIQLSVTLLIGIICLFIKLDVNTAISQSTFWTIIFCSAFLLLLFVLVFLNFKKIEAWFLSKFNASVNFSNAPQLLNKVLVSKLVLWSIFRYLIFSAQLLILIKLFYSGPFTTQLFSAVGLYFLLTTALPMISVIEAVVRSAIALLVFQGLQISEIALISIAVLLWLLNIVIPSIVGYIIIVRKNFEFNWFKQK